jgi:hypothetical protein
MFKVKDDLSIHITRGDIGILGITAKNEDNTDYIFQVGDIIRLGVFEKKKFSLIKLQKDVTVQEQGTEVQISLNKEDTTIGDIINTPVDYWYEIQLNPETNPQTIIGYDENGAKIFRLYPEGVEKE